MRGGARDGRDPNQLERCFSVVIQDTTDPIALILLYATTAKIRDTWLQIAPTKTPEA